MLYEPCRWPRRGPRTTLGSMHGLGGGRVRDVRAAPSPAADEGGQMKTAIAALTMAAALSVPAMAHDHDTLVRFEGGIGVIPASAAAGPANADGTFPNVKSNIGKGVPP